MDLFPDIQFDKSKFLDRSMALHYYFIYLIIPVSSLDYLTLATDPWGEEVKRKQFFEDYARLYNFDPHVPESWYSQSKKLILAVQVRYLAPFLLILLALFCINSSLIFIDNMLLQGASRVLAHHNGSLATALLDLFPDIGLQKERLWSDCSMSSFTFCYYITQTKRGFAIISHYVY